MPTRLLPTLALDGFAATRLVAGLFWQRHGCDGSFGGVFDDILDEAESGGGLVGVLGARHDL